MFDMRSIRGRNDEHGVDWQLSNIEARRSSSSVAFFVG